MSEPDTSTAAIAATAAALTASKRAREKSENDQLQHQEDKPSNPILSFFVNIFQLLPLPKKQPEPSVPDSAKPRIEESVPEPKPPTVVTYPKHEQELPSLKLEAEDADTNTNPVLLWQVYAIGGFFVLRWAWTRWNERKGKKKPSDGEPPSAHD